MFPPFHESRVGMLASPAMGVARGSDVSASALLRADMGAPASSKDLGHPLGA